MMFTDWMCIIAIAIYRKLKGKSHAKYNNLSKQSNKYNIVFTMRILSFLKFTFESLLSLFIYLLL